MWPFLKNPAEQYFGRTPTALLQDGESCLQSQELQTCHCKAGENRGCSACTCRNCPISTCKVLKGRTENQSKVICDASCYGPQEKDVLVSQLCWNSEFPLLDCVWWKYRPPISCSNMTLVPCCRRSFSPRNSGQLNTLHSPQLMWESPVEGCTRVPDTTWEGKNPDL